MVANCIRREKKRISKDSIEKHNERQGMKQNGGRERKRMKGNEECKK